jgi:hypothetical protein
MVAVAAATEPVVGTLYDGKPAAIYGSLRRAA